MKKKVLAIFLATIWISLSEFFRNEFLFKSAWVNHYKSLGLVFPDNAINGIIWGIWSLCLAIVIFIFAKKFNTIETTLLSWFVAFVLMWLVIGNLSVLPSGLLLYATPLSLPETFLATYIIKKINN